MFTLLVSWRLVVVLHRGPGALAVWMVVASVAHVSQRFLVFTQMRTRLPLCLPFIAIIVIRVQASQPNRNQGLKGHLIVIYRGLFGLVSGPCPGFHVERTPIPHNSAQARTRRTERRPVASLPFASPSCPASTRVSIVSYYPDIPPFPMEVFLSPWRAVPVCPDVDRVARMDHTSPFSRSCRSSLLGGGAGCITLTFTFQVRSESISCSPRDELPSATTALASSDSTDAMCLSRRHATPPDVC